MAIASGRVPAAASRACNSGGSSAARRSASARAAISTTRGAVRRDRSRARARQASIASSSLRGEERALVGERRGARLVAGGLGGVGFGAQAVAQRVEPALRRRAGCAPRASARARGTSPTPSDERAHHRQRVTGATGAQEHARRAHAEAPAPAPASSAASAARPSTAAASSARPAASCSSTARSIAGPSDGAAVSAMSRRASASSVRPSSRRRRAA